MYSIESHIYIYNVLPHQLHSFIFIYCTASQLLESVVLLLVLNHSNHAYFSVQVLLCYFQRVSLSSCRMELTGYPS